MAAMELTYKTGTPGKNSETLTLLTCSVAIVQMNHLCNRCRIVMPVKNPIGLEQAFRQRR